MAPAGVFVPLQALALVVERPEFFKNKTNFLILWVLFTNFDKYVGEGSANFVKNCDL